MKFKIHRGTQEIGGSCVEIWTAATRLVIDFGLPLVNPDRTPFDSRALKEKTPEELIQDGILPNVPGLYQDSPETSLLLSHAHQDHYGLINYIKPDCPVYLGKATHKLIELTNLFTHQEWVINNPHYFQSGKTYTIGDILITPYLMDHSAFDAYAFLVGADGSSLFYSGDFRSHGRKSKAFEWFIHNVKAGVDYLLLEGTTLGRSDQRFPTETDIENELVSTFANDKGPHLIYASGQNIDRLVSIFRACRRTGKILALDFYIANVLKTLSAYGRLPFPSRDFPEIRVFFPYRLARMISNQGKLELLYQFKDYKITKKQISDQADRIVMTVRPGIQGDLDYIENLDGGQFIYSMWEGYKEESSTKEFLGYLGNRGLKETYLHTSGHADQATLQKMVEILKPKKIVPIHTFTGDEYENVFGGDHIERVSDTEVVTLE
jgi:ribonuclease J